MKRILLALVLLLAVFVLPVAAQGGSHTISFDNVSFTYPEALATGVQIESIAATPLNADGPLFEVHPAHVQVTLLAYNNMVGDRVPNPVLEAQLFVFPTESFQEYAAGTYGFPDQLVFLQALLDGQGDLNSYAGVSLDSPEIFLPFLPLVNARQVMRLHPQIISFENVRGIRYLAYYSQGMNPISEGEIFYTFQGLTSDGSHYISAVLPVRSGILPETADTQNINWDAFAAGYRDYVSAAAQSISDQQEDAFSPSLATLDALMQSVSIGPSN